MKKARENPDRTGAKARRGRESRAGSLSFAPVSGGEYHAIVIMARAGKTAMATVPRGHDPNREKN
ncbi:hypothetical protein AA21291_0271 [Swaminathania salitolerans LMG 21291]|uniref:Uncharacterized protein n=1 Tax=Swaminathania salitolerans TaxID=182838 RepID=A0A511BLA2_9PROT|nr:hypothetical protein AA21291_0271 [Swaminathania salitolerans LMG 21291]GEL01129.1 hypothetical protein SSA02_02920 [Swaminathania salitolerans]